MQRPIADTVGTDVAVDVAVVEPGFLGIGAPVENRHPAPGGLNAAILMIGGGRLFDGPSRGVVGVDDVEDRTVVVGLDVLIDVVECSVVVASAAGER